MKNKTLFKGCASALATPFDSNGIDVAAFIRLLDYSGSVDALVVCGTTGESATLTDNEKLDLLSLALDNSHLPIIFGSGSNDTEKAVSLSKKAAEFGASALLVVTPYYNKTSDKGLVSHYFKIAEASTVPIIVYNVPSRTGVDISISVYDTLISHENICGVKEASGNILKISRLIKLARDRAYIYSGSDELNLPILMLGGDGIISVGSNLLPSAHAELCRLCFSGKYALARELADALAPLYDFLFCETNPIPLKYALSKLGICQNLLRLPLVSIDASRADLYPEELIEKLKQYERTQGSV